MENVEKLRMLLQHWIEHNSGHVAEFARWRTIMTDEQNDRLATALDQAVAEMNKVSETLKQALHDIGGPADGKDHHHHHHHH